MTLILGSQSPRRREILGFFKLPFTVASPPFDEETVAFKGDPEAFAMEIAMGKARALQPEFPHGTLLTADTVVYCDGKVYGKPSDEAESFSFLKELAGKWHSVFTAVTLKTPTEEFSSCEESRVQMHHASDEQLRKYCMNAHCLDKAGSYSCQMSGGIIVNRIEGCYYNCMGLPIKTLCSLLQRINIDLWDFIDKT